MSEKTEKATPHHLKKAKDQGQVSQSRELSTCLLMLVLLAVAAALWPTLLIQVKSLLRQCFILNTRLVFGVGPLFQLQNYLLSRLLGYWLPFAVVGLMTIVLATMAQTGFVWSFKPLTPNLARLNIANGFKRFFSSKLLFDAGKNTFKLTTVVLLLGLSIRHEIPTFLHLINVEPIALPPLIIAIIGKLILQLSVLLLAFSLIDTLYTRWKFQKDHRMSPHDLKDEHRQREGCPKVKAKRKQLQHQLRQKTASLEQVKTADVVITNPTHLAVVLKYDRRTMPAPKVVCKVEGAQVQQVRLLAHRHRVPIIENKTFARALFKSSTLNHWIDRVHYPIAALIFRDLYQKKAPI